MPEAREATADTSVWPLLRRERTWSPWRLGIALATAASASPGAARSGSMRAITSTSSREPRSHGREHDRHAARASRCGADLHPVRHRVGRFHEAAVRLEGLDNPCADAAALDHRLERDPADILREVAHKAPLGARLAARGTQGHADHPVPRRSSLARSCSSCCCGVRAASRISRTSWSPTCSWGFGCYILPRVTALARARGRAPCARARGPCLELHHRHRDRDLFVGVLVGLHRSARPHGARWPQHRGTGDGWHGPSRAAPQPDRRRRRFSCSRTRIRRHGSAM